MTTNQEFFALAQALLSIPAGLAATAIMVVSGRHLSLIGLFGVACVWYAAARASSFFIMGVDPENAVGAAMMLGYSLFSLTYFHRIFNLDRPIWIARIKGPAFVRAVAIALVGGSIILGLQWRSRAYGPPIEQVHGQVMNPVVQHGQPVEIRFAFVRNDKCPFFVVPRAVDELLSTVAFYEPYAVTDFSKRDVGPQTITFKRETDILPGPGRYGYQAILTSDCYRKGENDGEPGAWIRDVVSTDVVWFEVVAPLGIP